MTTLAVSLPPGPVTVSVTVYTGSDPKVWEPGLLAVEVVPSSKLQR